MAERRSGTPQAPLKVWSGLRCLESRRVVDSDALAAREAGIPTQEIRIDEALRRQLYGFLFHLTRNHAEAEDLVQESLLTAWLKRDLYEGRGSAIAYMRQTAFRLFLNNVARRRRRERLASEWGVTDDPRAIPQQEVDEQDALSRLVKLVREALENLPEEQRDAFLLFRFEGLSCHEVAQRTGTPVRTVETRIRRATLRLAEVLAPHRHLLRT